MTGNPLSGHTAANEVSMTGSGVFTDSLEDGEHITSPSLTNMLEGVHGNGILLEEDTATGASNRHTPEDLPGVCEQVGNSYTVRITGGSAILDGVLYEFAGGPDGGTQDVEFTTTSDHKRATYTALTTGQEALIVVYVSTNTAEECITWEMGTPVTTASNTYPTTPSAFLSNPMSSGLDVTQSVVLAVIRVVYSATGGDLNISITESNDKRVFVRPTPMYLTPVTTGVVGNKTAVDSHSALDAVNGDTGNFADSRMGAIWQSYNSDGDATLYYSAKDSSDNRHTHVLGPVGYVSASPSTTTTFTFNEGQVFVLNPSTAIQFNPSGTFPLGHKVFVTNEAAHDTNAVTFDNAGIGIVLKGKEAGVFVYTGSAWKNVMLASGAISPNGHGANGFIQLSDGAGGFTSDSNLAWTASPAELTVTGKLTVTGLIDPPGLVLDEKASVAATGHTSVAAKGLLWVKNDTPNRLYFTDGDDTDKKVILATDSVTELSDVSAVGSGSIITSAERTKLTGIETGATGDQTDAEIRAAVEAATDSNVFTDADHTKLDGIASGAEVNVNADWNAGSGDAQILNKPSDVTDLSTHSVTELNDVTNAGSGAIITSAERTTLGSALQTETDPVFTASAAASITNAGSGAVITSAERTTLGSALQAETDPVFTASEANLFAAGDASKLAGIATGATAYADADAIAAVEGEATLDLTGNVGLADGKHIKWGTDSYIQSNASGVDLTILATDDMFLMATDAIGLRNNGTYTMWLTATNGVGVGTTTPAEKLDVVGNIGVSGTVDGRDVATDGTKLDGIPTGQYQRFVLEDALGSPTAITAGTTTQLTFGPTGAVLVAQYTAPTDFIVPAANTHIEIVTAGLYQFTLCGFIAGISGSNPDYRLTISSTSSLTGDILSFRNRTQTVDRYTGSGVATVYLAAASTVYFSVFCGGRSYQVGGLETSVTPAEVRTFLDVRRLE